MPPTTFTLDGTPTPATRPLAVETPVAIAYGTVPYAVMMMTPDHLDDFALGFSRTEGIVATPGDIRHTETTQTDDGLTLRVDLAPARFHAILARRRAMAGRTSCGVCGIETLDALPRTPPHARPTPPIHLAAIQAALRALPPLQLLNHQSGALHAAAWADSAGTIHAVREDVGRHNALDKLIGAVLRQSIDPADGFVLVTSRCSYEMVEKVAALGATTLVALSAPTSLGVARAQAHGIALLGAARPRSLTAYTGADRVRPGAPGS